MVDDSPASPAAAVPFAAVPLFPLPHVVLYPRAILPLHIFEERYKSMIADVLKGDRRIAMALLLPGWEKTVSAQPKVDPTICTGTIAAHEKLADGTFNLLLVGEERARIISEIQQHPYRIAQFEPLQIAPVMEIDLSNERRRLIAVFSNGQFANAPVCQKFLDMLAGSQSTSEIADQVAFNVLEDIKFKQQLLAETDHRRRVSRIVAAVETLQYRT